MKIAAIGAFCACLAVGDFPARAQEVRAGDIVVEKAWARATPRGADVAAGYLTIRNTGDVADRLTGISADFAASAQAHEMRMANGVMIMRAIEGGLSIPAHGAVTLAPGGSHLMFAGLKDQLKQGESIKASLVFERAGTIVVALPVLGLGATGLAQ